MIDSAILSIEHLSFKTDCEIMTSIFIQGKSGDICIAKFNSENKSFDVIFADKISELVGFKKVILNNTLWIKQEDSLFKLVKDDNKNTFLFDFYCADNEENQILNFFFDSKSLQKRSFYLQTKDNLKLKSTCFIEPLNISNENKIIECVIIGEEDQGKQKKIF